MDDSRASGTAASSTLGLEEHLATPLARYCALALCAALGVVALCAGLTGMRAGPVIAPFIPITATVWSLADLLTGFLLVAQFFVNGKPIFALLASAYAFSGLLTWPYVAAFPGLFNTRALEVGEQQISITLWTLWHCAFPLLVGGAALASPRLKRIVSRRKVRTVTAITFIAPSLAAATVAASIYAARDMLPHLIVAGHFQPIWVTTVVPVVAALNGLACVALVARRRLTVLFLWLAVATFASALDALLNLSVTRYSYAWDVGKLITVFTSGVVLVMILCDIVEVYGWLARLTRVDALTSLQNRRSFEEQFAVVFANARRSCSSVALLVIDVDSFAPFNDTYGHSAGDECLRRVATEIATCATRPLDLVTRYGGQVFVIVLPDTPVHGALITAERVRAVVEGLHVVHDGKPLGRVTVSIGVGYAPEAQQTDRTKLFDAADRALLDAKDRGRNRVVLSGVAEDAGTPQARPTRSTAAMPAID